MSFLNDIFGSKPKVPSLPSIEAAQGAAVRANVASFADIAKLATQVDTFNQSQLEQLMEKQLPGGAAKIRDLISSRLAGEIPDDVLKQLRRSNAERTAGALTGGSGFSLGRELSQQLGMSLQLQNEGFNSALAWMQASRAPTFNVASMFLTPQQKYEDQVNQFNRQFAQAKIDAAPDPVLRGIHDTVMEMAGMAAGAFGGGGGGYKNQFNPQQAFSSTPAAFPTTPNYGGGWGGTGFGAGAGGAFGYGKMN